MIKQILASLLLSFSLISYSSQEEVVTCEQCDNILKVIRVYFNKSAQEYWVEASTAEGLISFPEIEYKKNVFANLAKFLQESKLLSEEEQVKRADIFLKACKWPQQFIQAKLQHSMDAPE